MPPSAVRPRVPQPLDVVEDLPAEVVLDLHLGQRGRDVEHLLVGQLADLAGRVDVEAGEEARRGVRADAEEGFEGFLDVR